MSTPLSGGPALSLTAERGRDVVVLTANIAMARRRIPQLVTALREHRPDYAVVTEARNARWWLFLIRGYKLRQFTARKGDEAPGIALLIRRPRIIVRRWPMRMTELWRGPHGRRHRPRVLPVLITDDLPPLVGVHAPWPHGTAAWWETFRRVSRWLDSHPVAMAAGDWNAELHELAAAIRGRVQVVRGTKVDHVLTVGLKHLSTRRLAGLQPEGMHGWIVYRFQVKD